MSLKIAQINDFTTTLGIGESIIKNFVFNKNLLQTSYLSDESITNLTKLKKFKSESKSHRLGKIIRDLEILGQNIGKEFGVAFIDPIEYIIQLYYGDLLSLEKVYERINGKGISHSHYTGLGKLLTLTFKFGLRDASDNKTTRVYKSRTGEKSIEKTLERKQQRKAEFLSWFIKNTSPKIEDLDYDIFHSFDFKYKKLIYIIANVFHISKENFLKLQELNMGNQSLADRFNEQFEAYKIDFTIGHKDIARVFEKLKTNP